MASSQTSKSARARAPINAPHSWEPRDWEAKAPDVWPHDSKRGAWVVRAYRQELIDCDAITRIGKTLIVLGAGYTRWLEQRKHHVAEFKSNNPDLVRSRSRSATTVNTGTV